MESRIQDCLGFPYMARRVSADIQTMKNKMKFNIKVDIEWKTVVASRTPSAVFSLWKK